MSEGTSSQERDFQQAIATTITCRSIIKYSSNLNEAQKAEILEEIERTLGFLGSIQTTSVSDEARTSFALDHLAEDEYEELPAGKNSQQPAFSLPDLYRLYRLYLSEERLNHLESRYKIILGVIEQLQERSQQRSDETSGDLTTEMLVHKIRGFVTALYCMFREFAVLFTNLVEGKNISADTESLELLGKMTFDVSRQQIIRDISPLMRVYTTHLQLQERRGSLSDSAREASAFLIFLQDALGANFPRRHEVIVQLDALSVLFEELSHLLTDYEQAISAMLTL